MAPLLAARGKHFAATFCLHSNAETVRLGASAFARLKCALWQNNPPLLRAKCNTQSRGSLFHPQPQNRTLLSSVAGPEFSSVFDPCAQGKKWRRQFRVDSNVCLVAAGYGKLNLSTSKTSRTLAARVPE
jgi:hypothetical protein